MDAETSIIGDMVNTRCMDRALLEQKKKYQRMIMRQSKKIGKLKCKVGKLSSTIKFLQDTNEKQHKERCDELCDQEKELLEIAMILKTHGQEIKSKLKKVLKEMVNLPTEEQEYCAVSGVPASHCVRVYKALEERHARLAMRFLGLNDEGVCDESLPIIDTFKYMPRMIKVSLDIIRALSDYTNKNWVTTKVVSS